MKLLKLFLNFFISFFLLILIILLMFITCSKTLISKKNMSEFINDANILNVDVNALFNQEEIGITLKDKVIQLALENNIPKKIIDDILESKQINYLLGDFFSQTINYIVSDESKPVISEETIIDIKKEAHKSLERHINVMLDEEELDFYIDNYCKDITKIIPDRNIIIGDLDINVLKMINEFNVMYLYVIIILILIVFSIINEWYSFIKYLGICMFIAGVIFVVFGSMDYIITNIVINTMQGMQPFVLPLITNILTIWFKGGVLVSFSAITLLLIYMTINKVVK